MQSDWERLHASVWDRQPVWRRWLIGIVLVLWFVVPMGLVLVRMVAS